MINIAVVDDDINDRLVLCEHIQRYDNDFCGGERYRVVQFCDGSEFVASDEDFAAVFIDIDMPNMGGMQVACRIRERNQAIAIIFVTNIAQYAIDGYKVSALDYVLKPVEYYDFVLKMKKFERYISKYAAKQIAVRNTSGGTDMLDISHIEYIEVMQHYLTYHVKRDGSTYAINARGSISDAERELMAFSFCRCAKSFLINLNHVTALRVAEVVVGDAVLPIGRPYKDRFLKRFYAFIGGRI